MHEMTLGKRTELPPLLPSHPSNLPAYPPHRTPLNLSGKGGIYGSGLEKVGDPYPFPSTPIPAAKCFVSQMYISTEYVYTLYSSIKGAPHTPPTLYYICLSVNKQQ